MSLRADYRSGARLTPLLCAFAFLIVQGVAHAQSAANIILLIGDGMGLQQIRAGACFIGTNLVFEGWPMAAQARTFSANSAVTDSAAAGTAMATGMKVNNGVISLAQPGNGQPYETILEIAQRRGKRTGLATTTDVTDATPAAFAAHVTNRAERTRIADHYLNRSRPNVLLGASGAISAAGAAAAGYAVATNRAELLALSTGAAERVVGVFGSGNLPYEFDGVGELPHLSEMASAAIALLSHSTNGFFLMLEGGAIDHAGHDNDITRLVHEMAEFDRTVRVVNEWASTRTDTLLVVTADHETGGLHAVTNNGPQQIPSVSWTTTGHTGSNVGFYAWGPGSEGVTGILDNTAVHHTMLRALAVPTTGLQLLISAEGCKRAP